MDVLNGNQHCQDVDSRRKRKSHKHWDFLVFGLKKIGTIFFKQTQSLPFLVVHTEVKHAVVSTGLHIRIGDFIIFPC